MRNEEIDLVLRQALWIVKNNAPVDTSNLRDNAIKIESIGSGEWRIFVDEAIAPYMKFTNEPWGNTVIRMGNFHKGSVVERNRTWSNPNEKWFDDTIDRLVNYIAKALNAAEIIRR